MYLLQSNEHVAICKQVNTSWLHNKWKILKLKNPLYGCVHVWTELTWSQVIARLQVTYKTAVNVTMQNYYTPLVALLMT